MFNFIPKSPTCEELHCEPTSEKDATVHQFKLFLCFFFLVKPAHSGAWTLSHQHVVHDVELLVSYW